MGKCLDIGFFCQHCTVLYDSPVISTINVVLVEVTGTPFIDSWGAGEAQTRIKRWNT